MSNIGHKEEDSGRRHSIHFADSDGDEVNLVAVEEGQHSLGTADCHQEIYVLTGTILTPDGASYDGADCLIFNDGDVMEFSAEPGTSYLSYRYTNEPD